MKKILQDLSFSELENLISAFGEKPFRAKQLYTGLMRGKKISQINVPAELAVQGVYDENLGQNFT